MKTIFIFIIILTAFVTTINKADAQKMYAGLNLTYGMGICRMEGVLYSANLENNVDTYKSTAFSLGKGLSSGAYVGYMIRSNVGLELGINYFRGFYGTVYSDAATAMEYHYLEEFRIKANALRCVPAVRVNFGEKKLRTYIKTGIVLNAFTEGTLNVDYHEHSMGDSQESHYVQKFTGGLSIGFHSGVGLTYALGKCTLFFEATAYLQNWAPKHSEITEYTENGINALAVMTTSEKEIDYVNEYSYNYTNPPNESEPSKELRFLLPMSSVGITLGVQVPLGK
ncbi:MAG TPA: hypothetical protein VD905_01495 [Flavobacteriales bacterium]|nr:hypothetical protein [Flavobacteriales bacterium]